MLLIFFLNVCKFFFAISRLKSRNVRLHYNLSSTLRTFFYRSPERFSDTICGNYKKVIIISIQSANVQQQIYRITVLNSEFVTDTWKRGNAEFYRRHFLMLNKISIQLNNVWTITQEILSIPFLVTTLTPRTR